MYLPQSSRQYNRSLMRSECALCAHDAGAATSVDEVVKRDLALGAVWRFVDDAARTAQCGGIVDSEFDGTGSALAGDAEREVGGRGGA